MTIDERSIWLEARLISRSLAGLSGGVPNAQASCCAIIQLGLRSLFHDVLQSRDVVRNWKDLKRVLWFRTIWQKNDDPNWGSRGRRRNRRGSHLLYNWEEQNDAVAMFKIKRGEKRVPKQMSLGAPEAEKKIAPQ